MEVPLLKKLNNFLYIGLLIVGAIQFLNHLVDLPHFIYGLGLGIGLSFELIGVFTMKYDISKIRKYKINLLRKCFSK
jgi:hypothetical protein